MFTLFNNGVVFTFFGLVFLSDSSAVAEINAQIDVSRAKGVAPLAVFFDATSTTSTASNKPFHELQYIWNFNDPGAGNWGHGNRYSSDKNKSYGPVAAHVFEQPGTYIVELQVQEPGGDTSVSTVKIIVDDPDTVFSGKKTVCFSTSGDFNGCPSGSKTITTGSFQKVTRYLGSKKRLLLRKGETWNTNQQTKILSDGPGMISSYGSGSLRPKINNTKPVNTFKVDYRVKDWRITGLEFDGEGGDNDAILEIFGEAQDILFMGNKSADSFGRAVIANNALFRKRNWDIPQNIFIIDNDLSLFSAHIMFIAAGKLAIQGNYLDDTETKGGEHVVRITHTEQAVVQNNYFAHPLINKGVLTIRNAQRELQCPYCGRDTRDIVVSDNHFYGGADSTVALIGRQGRDYTAHGTDVIVERNFFSRSENKAGEVQMALNIANVDGITIRNNIVLMENWETYRGIDLGPVGGVTNVYVYNNSCYTPDNPSLRVRCINNRGATNVQAFNNLLYAPNHTEGTTVVVDGSVNGTGNIAALKNPFIAKEIMSIDDFRLAPNSVAIDAGKPVPIYTDYTTKGRSNPTQLDIGAYEAD